MSQLLTAAFWKDVLDRSFRQGLQVLLPLLALAATTGRVDIKAGAALLVAAATQALVVILRAVSGVRASDTAPWAIQVLDRSAAAAAGALAALAAAEGFNLLTADYRTIALSTVATVATALVHGYLSPPRSKDFALAA